MTTPIIEAQGLTKSYGEVQALAGLDLTAQPGQVVAVLGPNGAGKTTFVSTVATLLRPDSGSLHVGGVDVLRDPRQVRRIIGLAGQYAAVEEAMTGRENLVMVARLFGHDRHTAAANAAAVLDQLGLTDAGDRLVRTYSGGMRRRLDLGASLVGRAPPAAARRAHHGPRPPQPRRAVGGDPRPGGRTAPTCCSPPSTSRRPTSWPHQVVIIDHGRVIADGTPDELKAPGRQRRRRGPRPPRRRPRPPWSRALAPLGDERAPGRRGGPPRHRARRGRPGRHLGRGPGRRRAPAPRSTTSACAAPPSTRSSSRITGQPMRQRRPRVRRPPAADAA